MTAAPRPVPWGTEFANPFESPPTVPPAPVVEVRGCAGCPMLFSVGYSGRHDTACVVCRLAGELPLNGMPVSTGPARSFAPAGCPLRSGPVTLRLVDRCRP